MNTAIEIEVFGSLQPETKAQMFCYTYGNKKNHVFLSEVFTLDEDKIESILDCLRFAKTTKVNSTRYFLKEWL